MTAPPGGLLKLLPAVAAVVLIGCGGGNGATGSSGSGSTVIESGGSSSTSSSSSSGSSSSGSSSTSGSSGSATNQALGGIWTTSVGANTAILLTTEDGRFFYVMQESAQGQTITSTVRVGTLTVAGNTLSGTEQSADFTAGQCQGQVYCASGAAVAVTGSITQRTTLTLDGLTWTYNSLYADTSSLTDTTGAWSSYLASPNATDGNGGTLDISATGVLFDQDTTTNCLVTGQVSLINPTYNAYAVALTYAGTNCASSLNGVSGSGIGYIDEFGYLNVAVNLQAASTIVEAAVAQFVQIGGIWTGVNLPAGTTATLISDEAGHAFFRSANSSCDDLYETVFDPPTSSNPNFIGDSLIQQLPSSCGGVGDNGFYLFFNPTSLQLMAQNDNANTSMTYTLSLQSTAYDQPSSAALVAGMWTTPGADVLSIDASGAVASHDAASGCAITGQIASANPAYNVYYLTLHYSACTAVPADLSGITTDASGLNDSTLMGLATIDYSVSPNQLDLWSRINFSDGTGSALLQIAATAQ